MCWKAGRCLNSRIVAPCVGTSECVCLDVYVRPVLERRCVVLFMGRCAMRRDRQHVALIRQSLRNVYHLLGKHIVVLVYFYTVNWNVVMWFRVWIVTPCAGTPEHCFIHWSLRHVLGSDSLFLFVGLGAVCGSHVFLIVVVSSYV